MTTLDDCKRLIELAEQRDMALPLESLSFDEITAVCRAAPDMARRLMRIAEILGAKTKARLALCDAFTYEHFALELSIEDARELLAILEGTDTAKK